MFISFVSLRLCSSHQLPSACTYFIVRVISACDICTLPHLGIILFFIRAKRVSNCYIQEKKKTDRLCGCVCVDVRLILVLVLGRQTVYGQNTVYLCLSKYIVFENTHTHIATAASETEGVAAVSCMESHMN